MLLASNLETSFSTTPLDLMIQTFQITYFGIRPPRNCNQTNSKRILIHTVFQLLSYLSWWMSLPESVQLKSWLSTIPWCFSQWFTQILRSIKTRPSLLSKWSFRILKKTKKSRKKLWNTIFMRFWLFSLIGIWCCATLNSKI